MKAARSAVPDGLKEPGEHRLDDFLAPHGGTPRGGDRADAPVGAGQTARHPSPVRAADERDLTRPSASSVAMMSNRGPGL